MNVQVPYCPSMSSPSKLGLMLAGAVAPNVTHFAGQGVAHTVGVSHRSPRATGNCAHEQDQQTPERTQSRLPGASNAHARSASSCAAIPGPSPGHTPAARMGFAHEHHDKGRRTPARNRSSHVAASAISPAKPSPVESTTRTTVAVRLRPPNDSEEVHEHFESCISVDVAERSIDISRSYLSKKHYVFDTVFDESAETKDIYEVLVQPNVGRVVAGFNAVVTAYGQSSTGKTYTFGSDGNNVNSGCILRACSALLNEVHQEHNASRLKLYLSMAELCNEEIRDLLVADISDARTGRQIAFQANTHHLKGASVHAIDSVDDCVSLLRRGSKSRCEHQKSHLGHMLVKFVFVRELPESVDGKAEDGSVVRGSAVCSSLSFVELAGSEWRDLNCDRYMHVPGGRTPEDARCISNALASLSSIMYARKNHLPLRSESKLSTLLHDALAGNSHWTVVITIGPSVDFLHETTTSLLFGKRAMHMQNAPLWNREVAPVLDSNPATPALTNRFMSPTRHGARTVTPGYVRSGSMVGTASKHVRLAQTVAPKARRKISFHPFPRLGSAMHENPDAEFTKYVARQLGGGQDMGNQDDQEESRASPGAKVPETCGKLHCDQELTQHRTPKPGMCLQSTGTSLAAQRPLEKSALDNCDTCGSGCHSMPDAQSLATNENALRLGLEDLVSVHEHGLNRRASLPSTMVLDEMEQLSHLLSFRKVLRVMLDRPEGAMESRVKLEGALAQLEADAGKGALVMEHSAVGRRIDTPSWVTNTTSMGHESAPQCDEIVAIMAGLLAKDGEESSQDADAEIREWATKTGEGVAVLPNAFDDPCAAREGDCMQAQAHDDEQAQIHQLVSTVLCSHFDSEDIKQALHFKSVTYPAPRKTAEDEMKCSQDSMLSDLYAAHTCDALRQPSTLEQCGSAMSCAAVLEHQREEVLQRLASVLQTNEEQSLQLAAHRREAVAAYTLFHSTCQLAADSKSRTQQAIANRRRVASLSAQLERSSAMLQILGRALVEEKHRSAQRVCEMQRGWQDSIEKLAFLEDQVLELRAQARHEQEGESKTCEKSSLLLLAPDDQPPCKAGPESKVMRLHLSLDLEAMGQEGSEERDCAEQRLCIDLAQASNLSPENFLILGIRPGSVAVDVEILHHSGIDGDWSPTDILQDLLLQADSRSSKLLNGELTQYMRKLTAETVATAVATEAGTGLADDLSADSHVPLEQELDDDDNEHRGKPLLVLEGDQEEEAHGVEASVSSPPSPGKRGALAYTLETDVKKLADLVSCGDHAAKSSLDRRTAHAEGQPRETLASSAAENERGEQQRHPSGVRPSVDQTHLTSAKTLIAVSLKHTQNYWEACAQLFLTNRSGAAIRKRIGVGVGGKKKSKDEI